MSPPVMCPEEPKYSLSAGIQEEILTIANTQNQIECFKCTQTFGMHNQHIYM